MTATLPRFQRATTPFAAFDQAIETANRHRTENRLGAAVAQWETLLTMFKQFIELPHLAGMPAGSGHRSVLTGLMSMGESFQSQIEKSSGRAMEGSGFEKEFVEANVRYLRTKYLEWYADKDVDQITSDLARITNECGKAA